ncbi:HAD-IA family hydrolase [Bacillus andreraoultii]|uniref:HAD-IA family hydrolase n=1 Tax=Bacillus andreraoultii TaxID=1499685 RepID=UPI000539CC91|nr:HAD-IA family hydrolase [Bacillus andreraoultii]
MNILWDLDGTLFDTYPKLVESFIKLSGEPLDPDEVLRWMKKDSKQTFKHFGISEDKREEFQQIDFEFKDEDKKPFPYVEDVLKMADKNVIVTHRNRESTLRLLKHWNLDQYFNEVVCPEEDGFPRKPDVASYVYVHEKYHIDLVIGDRALDVIPGKKLGIRTCLFQNDEAEADFHISSYQKFSEILKSTGFQS